MDDLVVLIKGEIGKDDEGYAKLKILKQNTVYAEVNSPKRAQRDSAMRRGYVATRRVKVNLCEYSNENYIRIENQLFEIKESYELDENYLELTCSDMRCEHGKA